LHIKLEVLTPTDRILLTKVIERDRIAQKQFYHAYVKLVGHIAYRYMHNANEVTEVVQNTFVSIFQNIHKYDEAKGSIQSWISRITINEALGLLRSQNRLKFDPIEHSTDVGHSVSTQEVFSKFALEEVTTVIHSLSDSDRIILDLFFYEQYSHQEIAQALDISVESSRIRLHRAKKSFFQKWDKIKKDEIRRII